MGQLYIPKESKISGPWFIGKEELEELDAIVDKIEELLIASNEKEIEHEANVVFKKGHYDTIEKALEKTKKYSEDRKFIRKVFLIADDEKRLIDKSIIGLLKDPLLSGFNPKSLTIKIEHGYSNSFTLNLHRKYDGELDYNFKCFDSDSEEEIKYLLENWIEKNEPNRIKKMWGKYSFGILSFSFVLGFILTLNFALSNLDSHKKIYKQEIEQLIKTGVNEANQNKAIELLLKYNIEYVPLVDTQKKTLFFTTVEKRILFVLFCVMIVSFFRPKTTIGIGKQKNVLKFYKIYTTTVLITIPVIFIVTPLIDTIKGLLGL